jgi:hypothetical protein
MLGHRRREVSVVTGWKVDRTEREGDDIVLKCDGRGCLILKRWDGMVVVTAVCKDWGHQTDAREESEECLTHKTSQE